jgi:hypothetical protein
LIGLSIDLGSLELKPLLDLLPGELVGGMPSLGRQKGEDDEKAIERNSFHLLCLFIFLSHSYYISKPGGKAIFSLCLDPLPFCNLLYGGLGAKPINL